MDDLPTIAIRLADEGVPVRAIARAINVPSSELWQQFDQAMYEGRLVEAPRADWPTNTSRRDRSPELQRKAGQAALLKAVVRVFAVTPNQGRLLLALIHHTELSNDQLHAIYNNRDGQLAETGRKIIDVEIHHLRKKLEPFGLEIETRWGFGKYMLSADRKQASNLVLKSFEE